jgi:hypothetical protein
VRLETIAKKHLFFREIVSLKGCALAFRVRELPVETEQLTYTVKPLNAGNTYTAEHVSRSRSKRVILWRAEQLFQGVL